MTPISKFIYDCVNYVVNVADNDQSIAIIHSFEDGDDPNSDWGTLATRIAAEVERLQALDKRGQETELGRRYMEKVQAIGLEYNNTDRSF